MTATLPPTDSLPGQWAPDTQSGSARQGTLSDSGHPGPGAHTSNAAVGTTSPRAIAGSAPNVPPPVGTTTPAPTTERPTPKSPSSERATTSPQATRASTPIACPPAGDQLPEPTSAPSASTALTSAQGSTSDSGQARHGAQKQDAAVGINSGQPAKRESTPTPSTLADPTLALAADVVDDLERVRIAEENRLRSLTADDGFGLDETHSDVARLSAIVAALAKVEHDAILNLNRIMRRHPLGEWQRAQKGIGEKTFARLLATMGGDPYVNLATGEPRTVSQLWSYCGHGDPTRRIRKGMTQDDLFACGNPTAKKRLWLIASKCLMAQGPYADVYYARKATNEGRTHATECKRCGPSGKPAQPGSPWSDAHRHADALRIVGKEILRDLWTEAKRIHDNNQGASA